MDKRLYAKFCKDISKLRQIVVELKGPVEGISSDKKEKKPHKKQESPLISASNIVEKE